MKRLLSIGGLLAVLLLGCETGDVKHTNEQLLEEKAKQAEEINRLSQELAEVRKTAKDLENQLNKLTATKDRVDRLTNLNNFSFDVIAAGTARNENEIVVFVKDVPNDLAAKETYVLRAAIQFSNERNAIISLWNHEALARQYSSGDYDNEETFTGWTGFDARFGIIDNTQQNERLRLFLSRDDIDNLEFGKYGVTER